MSDTKTKSDREVTITVTLREQDLNDTVTTAVEGGIGYWFRGLEYVWDCPEPFIAGYISDEAAEATDVDNFYGYGSLDDAVERKINEDAVLATTTVIDADTIAAGVRLIVSGQVGIRGDLLRQVMTLVGPEDSVDVDADAADCIVQAGLFGELVYG